MTLYIILGALVLTLVSFYWGYAIGHATGYTAGGAKVARLYRREKP